MSSQPQTPISKLADWMMDSIFHFKVSPKLKPSVEMSPLEIGSFEDKSAHWKQKLELIF